MTEQRWDRGMTQRYDMGEVFKQILADDKGKTDIILPMNTLNMDYTGVIRTPDIDQAEFRLSDWATTQMAQKLNIPVRYFKNCPPELQAENFNHWAKQSGSELLLRTRNMNNPLYEEHIIRGTLSTDYTKLDNHQIVDILTQILGNGVDKTKYDIVMWHMDDGGFHLRIVFDALTSKVGTLADGSPDLHKVGLHITNSEVGKGSVTIAPMIYRLVCTNGLMAWTTDGEIFRQRHVGLKDHEIYGRVAEAIGSGLKAGHGVVNSLIIAKQTEVLNPLAIIDQLAEDKNYSQAFADQVKMSYAVNAQQTGNNVFSLVQAITESAQQANNPDTRIEFEKDASQLLRKLVA